MKLPEDSPSILLRTEDSAESFANAPGDTKHRGKDRSRMKNELQYADYRCLLPTEVLLDQNNLVLISFFWTGVVCKRNINPFSADVLCCLFVVFSLWNLKLLDEHVCIFQRTTKLPSVLPYDLPFLCLVLFPIIFYKLKP